MEKRKNSSYVSHRGLIARVHKELKQTTTKPPIIQWINRPMNWPGNSQKRYKWLINIWKWIQVFHPSGEANENNTEFSSQPSQNGWKVFKHRWARGP